MADTLNLIKEIMHSDVQFVTDKQGLRPKDSEVFRLWGDNSLVKSLTGWQPEYNIKEGLKETIAWFVQPKNLKNYKAGFIMYSRETYSRLKPFKVINSNYGNNNYKSKG